MAILSDFYTPPTPEPTAPRTTSSTVERFQTGAAFGPDIGKCYEVHFGKIQIGAQTGFGFARIRVNGQCPSRWVDLETNECLDPRYGIYAVQGFREIECHNNQAGAEGT